MPFLSAKPPVFGPSNQLDIELEMVNMCVCVCVRVCVRVCVCVCVFMTFVVYYESLSSDISSLR